MVFLPRTRQTICLVFVGILVQYLFVYLLWTFFCENKSDSKFQYIFPSQSSGKITCIIYSSGTEHNDLAATIQSFIPIAEVSAIIIVSDRKLYPRLAIQNKKLIYYQRFPDIRISPQRKTLRDIITTEWILLVPDGTVSTETSLSTYLSSTQRYSARAEIFAFRVRGKRASCQSVAIDWKRWTLTANSSSSAICDAVTGSVVHLIATRNFLRLPEPLFEPVDESLLVQSFAFGWKFVIFENTPFLRSSRLLDPQILSEQRNSRYGRIKSLYEHFQIKKVIKNGVSEMFGCSKDTPRCFGSVINETPSYLHEGRWTPPCCINALKITLQHVIETFDFNNVPYWLEGGSLLGAARNGELIPWDYDIDIGMFLNDTKRIQYLEAVADGPVLDPDGFVWERSAPTEGEFYRVQYSRSNRMHVDIFPFYSNNSVMTKNFWFSTHPQDREFPETFLTPLETIQFMGLAVSAPNNVRDFLELKFGKGCIENAKYPHEFNFNNG